MVDINKLKLFHGELYSEGPWDSREYHECRLCKTKNIEPLHGHWASGLCRSCYRRLSPKHRQYNDEWTKKNNSIEDSSVSKKAYKEDKLENIKFLDKDVNSLLERYDFKCGYCKDELQVHSIKRGTFLNIEYMKLESGEYELVPICKSCSCSKKNLQSEYDLKMWAMEYRIPFPFKYIKPID